ncbi:methionyl-tRNA formyltransferase, partial [Candidatus Saccharibacteria bacterium]|nr:methionyl-tRNA formyltransferase [Candidatus Saccharibacteria bacterium]
KTIVFFGTDSFSADSLEVLIECGFNIAAVVTKPDSAKGRSKELTPSPVKILAQKHSITVLQPDKVSEISKEIKNIKGPIGVLVSYGNLIPQEVLNLFEQGIVNLHPSLLPKYRGPSPIESVILNGEKETGVTFIQLTNEMDAGPIYYQAKFEIPKDQTASELYETLGFTGAIELKQILPEIMDGTLQPSPQDDTQATYCNLIEKKDGIIDWNKPAQQIEREVRAYNIWPKSRTKLGDVEAIITAARVTDGNGNPGSTELRGSELIIYCGKDCLSIDKIQPLGKKEMPVQAFLAGYKNKIIVQ